jgi:hypothetical protein
LEWQSIPTKRDPSWQDVEDPEKLAATISGYFVTTEGWQIEDSSERSIQALRCSLISSEFKRFLKEEGIDADKLCPNSSFTPDFCSLSHWILNQARHRAALLGETESPLLLRELKVGF